MAVPLHRLQRSPSPRRPQVLCESSLGLSSASGLPKGRLQPQCCQPALAEISALPRSPHRGLLTRPPGCCLQVNQEHREFVLHPWSETVENGLCGTLAGREETCP